MWRLGSCLLVCYGLILGNAALVSGQDREAPRWSVITVMPGDTLEDLAEQFEVSVPELCDWNALLPDTELRMGERLKVLSYISRQERFVTHLRIRKETTWRYLARKYDVPLETLLKANHRRHDGRVPEGKHVVVFIRKDRWNKRYLDGGVQLEDSDSLEVKHPKWAWGRPVAVRTLETVAEALAEAFPGTRTIVGDLSKKRGGRFPPHKSHRGGLDADIGLFRVDKPDTIRFRNLKPDQIDARRMWFMLQTFLETGRVERILLDWHLQKPVYEEAKRQGVPEDQLEEWFQYPSKAWKRKGVIQHYRGHRHHIHVRFIEPDGEPIL